MADQWEPQLILVDKPAGVTSHDVVDFWRRELAELSTDGCRPAVGHAGTLDPFATGLLVILVGDAVKTQADFLGSNKRYRATLKLGEATDTGDREGKLTERAEIPPLQEKQVAEMLASWPNPFTQRVPYYAAAKIDGWPLYRYARAGKQPPRWPIRVCRASDWSIIDLNKEFLTFAVTVSAGCYIRSLGEEIARRLGTVGHLSELRRLESGALSVDSALPISRSQIDNRPQA